MVWNNEIKFVDNQGKCILVYFALYSVVRTNNVKLIELIVDVDTDVFWPFIGPLSVVQSFEDEKEKCSAKYPSMKGKCPKEPCAMTTCAEAGAVCK